MNTVNAFLKVKRRGASLVEEVAQDLALNCAFVFEERYKDGSGRVTRSEDIGTIIVGVENVDRSSLDNVTAAERMVRRASGLVVYTPLLTCPQVAHDALLRSYAIRILQLKSRFKYVRGFMDMSIHMEGGKFWLGEEEGDVNVYPPERFIKRIEGTQEVYVCSEEDLEFFVL
ncbi:hypothetical protein ACFLZN_02090 [Nanoarchaeota archaeon]